MGRVDNLPIEIPYKHTNWDVLRVCFNKNHTIIAIYYFRKIGSEEISRTMMSNNPEDFYWKHYQ